MPARSARVLAAVALLLAASAATAQVPTALSYQGVLETGGQPVTDPAATLTFRLFSAATGGSELWTETQTGVAIADGVFAADLGTASPLGAELFFGPLYLSVAVGDASAAQLAPRTALQAAPYARTLAAPAAVFGSDEGPLLSVQNTAGGTFGNGLYAETGASAGRAVYGLAGAASGANVGVYGESGSGEGTGVFGSGYFGVNGAGAGSFSVGARGTATGTLSSGVAGMGGYWGVYGTSTIGVEGDGGEIGVYGRSVALTGVGVRGGAPDIGVYGIASNFGVRGEGNYTGVVGVATPREAVTFGVLGVASGPFGIAVFGDNLNPSGFAGTFQGRVNVTGTLTKGGGAFQIDHPLAPATRILRHSFVESPDMMNVYNGNVTLDVQGAATVTLPAYFETLNRDFRYGLTCIGGYAPVYVAQEVRGNQFRIGGGTPGLRVSWQVTGIRQDAWANENRIVVEEDKPADDRGQYLHPSAFGLAREQGVDYDAEREARTAAARDAREDAPPPFDVPAPISPPLPPRRDR